jgi:hypothetical protein
LPIPSKIESVSPYGLYKNITTSTLIKTGTGVAVGLIVNSHTSGTVRLSDAITSTTPYISGVITLATSGTYDRFIPFFGLKFTTGLYVTTTGTVNLTVVYN